jgi:hypothetical protein
LDKVTVLSFLEPKDASYLQDLIDSVKTMRTGQSVGKLNRLWAGLTSSGEKAKQFQVQSDLFVSQVIKRIRPAVTSESKHRRLEFSCDNAVSALEDYVALFHIYEVKQSLLAVLDTEDYNATQQQNTVHTGFKELFDRISVPIQEWENVFGQHQDLAETIWIGLTWTQRLSLKQGFLARRLYKYLNEASTP